MSKKSSASKFILGAAVGAIVGFLFSPKSGKENRKILMEKANDLLEKAKEIDVKEVKEALEEKVSRIMNELKDLDKEKVLEIGKKKSKEIIKQADELVKYAKEKATPIIEDAALELKEKAKDTTKRILEKLES